MGHQNGSEANRRLTITEYTALTASITALQQAQATLQAVQTELGWLEGEEYNVTPDRFVMPLKSAEP